MLKFNQVLFSRNSKTLEPDYSRVSISKYNFWQCQKTVNTRRLTLDAKFYPDRFFPNRELPKRAPIVYLTREGNFNSARWVRRTKNSMPDQVWSDKILHNGSGCGCLKPSGLFYGRGAEPHLLTNVLSAISYKQINGCVGAACWRQIATPRAKTQPRYTH